MEIPHNLLNQLEEGNVVLFLGAGASRDAWHPSGQQIPDAKNLGIALAKKFLDDSFESDSLAHIAELSISERDLFTVQSFLYEKLIQFKASEFHKIIPTFKWKSIYTTNYDLVIEDAYEKVKDKIQDLSPVFRSTKIHQIFKSENSLPYYKLHGCLNCINDISIPLILTPDQYITHKQGRESLFAKLAEEAFNFTFVFVGFSFSDPDIRAVL